MASALCILCIAAVVSECIATPRTFEVNYERGVFLKDGLPVNILSGAIHYFRIPRASWHDRLVKARAAGLDAVETYIPWSLHEPEEGQFDFEGERDVAEFLRDAHEVGLLAIIRTGPYVCAELDLGGLPIWLLRKRQSVRLRSTDPDYLPAATRWLRTVLQRVARPLLYTGSNGPVIAVQIENEYGYSEICDTAYMVALYDVARSVLGDNVVLFTVDSPGKQRCGSIPHLALATTDFGINVDIDQAFEDQRLTNAAGQAQLLNAKFNQKARENKSLFGPEVNMEFYTGWLDHWQSPREKRDADTFVEVLDKLLARNSSVNFYMFSGGTNFAYLNGANFEGKVLRPQPTTYDYDAPLSEAGDTTWKYHLLRATIAKYRRLPDIAVPPNSTKFAYGVVGLHELASLADLSDSDGEFWLTGGRRGNKPQVYTYPRAMEQLGIWAGFALYTSVRSDKYPAGILQFAGGAVRDRAYVFNGDWIPLGVIDRNVRSSHRILLPAPTHAVHILVENIGHVNFGSLGFGEWKGLVSNVTLLRNVVRSARGLRGKDGGSKGADGDDDYVAEYAAEPLGPPVVLRDWTILHVNVSSVYSRLVIEKRPVAAASNKLVAQPVNSEKLKATNSNPQKVPGFYGGEFLVLEPHDSFLRIASGWRKGQLFINGFNLGRYWPAVRCPQRTLFVPASVLRAGTNYVFLFELEGGQQCDSGYALPQCSVKFVANAEIDVPCDEVSDVADSAYVLDDNSEIGRSNSVLGRIIAAVCLVVLFVCLLAKRCRIEICRLLASLISRKHAVSSKLL